MHSVKNTKQNNILTQTFHTASSCQVDFSMCLGGNETRLWKIPGRKTCRSDSQMNIRNFDCCLKKLLSARSLQCLLMCSRRSEWKHTTSACACMLTDDATLKNSLFSLISGTETAHRYCIFFLLSLANTHSYMPMCVLSLERHLMSCTCCVSAFDYLWSSFSDCIAAFVPTNTMISYL